MPTPFSIRLATPADLPAINALYNRYVLCSTCTYQTAPSTESQRAEWFAAHGEKHPVTVAERNGEVLGWGSLSKFHPREAFARTVEDSLYVRHDCHRQGIGAALLADLIARAKALDHHVVVAAISSEQTASIELHRRFEFVPAGVLKEVGFKFGRWLDAAYLQLVLK